MKLILCKRMIIKVLVCLGLFCLYFYFPIQKVKITDKQIFMLSEGQWGNRIPQTNNIYYKGSDILKITQ